MPTAPGDVSWPQPAESVLACAHPLPEAPPADLASRRWQRKPHNSTVPLSAKLAKRHAFMVCAAYAAVADALAHFKRDTCAGALTSAATFRIQPPSPI